MKNQASIDALQDRISVAARNCEAWRAAGLNDNYMEAYDLVEALQLQLRQQLRVPMVINPT